MAKLNACFTLPTTPEEFKEKQYWDSVFSKLAANAFEWYGEYETLSPLLLKYIRPADKILMVGCGNSQLSADIYDDGYFNVTNIDISSMVIKKMKSKNDKKRPKMSWLAMDVTKMSFDDSDFNVIIDKGTLDALMPDDADAARDTVDQMFRGIERVLRDGGRFMIVSLLQEHILKFLISWFGDEGWLVRFHKSDQDLTKKLKDRSKFPVFVVVCTKLKKVPGMKSIFELCIDANVKRIADTSDIVSRIHDLQQQSLVWHYISTE